MPSYSHLSTWEREQLAALKAAGTSGSSMARALGRSPDTISRGLRRNRLPGGGYSPRQADGAYLERRRRDAILESDRRLRQFVTDRLTEGWSPEQIAGWLKRNTEPKLRTLVTETIYAVIYKAAQQPEKLWHYLVRRRPRRRSVNRSPCRMNSLWSNGNPWKPGELACNMPQHGTRSVLALFAIKLLIYMINKW